QEERGRWILDSTHRDQHSEYALHSIIEGNLVHCIIDRTFLDAQQRRWIIDYKTTKPNVGEASSDFLVRAKTLHQPQLEMYARVWQQMDPRPVHLGLYFPVFGGWCGWVTYLESLV